eukprot:4730141-Amphidinium_carterae.2
MELVQKSVLPGKLERRKSCGHHHRKQHGFTLCANLWSMLSGRKSSMELMLVETLFCTTSLVQHEFGGYCCLTSEFTSTTSKTHCKRSHKLDQPARISAHIVQMHTSGFRSVAKKSQSCTQHSTAPHVGVVIAL